MSRNVGIIRSLPNHPTRRTLPQTKKRHQESPNPANLDYNKVIFQNAMTSDQQAFLRRCDGGAAGELMHDKQFRKLMRNLIPDCMFHYGHDMPLLEAMGTVLECSPQPVEIYDRRYLIVSGSGPGRPIKGERGSACGKEPVTRRQRLATLSKENSQRLSIHHTSGAWQSIC